MVNNKKLYSKLLLLIIAILILTGTQTLAASVARVTGLKTQTVSETQVVISWNKITNITGYQVYVKEDNGAYEHIGNTTSTRVSISNLEKGETYSIKVRAYKTTNGSTTYGSFSTAITFTTKGSNSSDDNTSTTVNRATNLKVGTVTETTVKLTWTKSSNATGYQVYIKEKNGTYENLGSVTNANVTISGLEAGKTYYVKVRAYRTVNGTTTYATQYSNEVNFTTKGTSSDTDTALGTVTNLKVGTVTETTAKLTWNKVTNATGYEVYIRTATGSYEKIGNTTNTNVTILGLTEGTTYYVKIRAFRIVNGTTTYAKNYSSEVKVVTDSEEEEITKPAQVTNLKTKNITKTTTDLMWNRVTGATGYEIYLRTAGTSYSSQGTTTNTYGTLINLTANTTYYAKVRACKTVNGTTVYGDFSTEVIFTTAKESTAQEPDTTINKVLNLKVDATTTQAKLTWDATTDIDGYEIYVNNQGKGYISLGKTSKTSATIIGLVAGKTYNVKVRAYKDVNGTITYGEFSDEVTFTTTTEETLGAITNLQVSLSSKQAKLTWDKVPTATRYEVYIKLPGEEYRMLGTVGNIDNVRIVNLTVGSSYSVKMRAYKVVNGTTVYGDFSNEVTFTAE